MAEICQEVIKVTTTGSAGSATGDTTGNALKGFLLDIYLDYHDSAPNTSDVTVSFAERGGNILVVENNATDGLYVPLKDTVDSAGAAISSVYDHFALNGRIKVAIAQADALVDCVTAYVRYLREG